MAAIRGRVLVDDQPERRYRRTRSALITTAGGRLSWQRPGWDKPASDAKWVHINARVAVPVAWNAHAADTPPQASTWPITARSSFGSGPACAATRHMILSDSAGDAVDRCRLSLPDSAAEASRLL
ncbi:hypothetical protein [Actinokineospora sp.]|uniref:hypothetical protein n=1 Tax=Actinokineospora sp. TaxID=1872133 RepID=UPI004037D63B